MAKYYTGYSIFKTIADNAGKVRAAVSGGYIIVWPAPEPYMLPMRPAYGYVFTEQLTAAPGKYPGGCYALKRYTVAADRCTMPRKYRDLLRPGNYLN